VCFALTGAAVHFCWLNAGLRDQASIGAIAMTQACCEPVLQSTTEQWGMHFAQISLLFSTALQNRLTACLSHSNLTWEISSSHKGAVMQTKAPQQWSVHISFPAVQSCSAKLAHSMLVLLQSHH